MITSKDVSDRLFQLCHRPLVPSQLGSIGIMQVDLENYTSVARPGDPIQNGEAPVLRLFGVTDNVRIPSSSFVNCSRGTRFFAMFTASMLTFIVLNQILLWIVNGSNSVWILH
jgi:hypothetical protein